MKKKIGIKISILMVTVLIILAITDTQYFPALLLSISIHELGHILVAKLRHIELSAFNLGIFGAGLVPTGMLFSYTDEILLCLGGPLFNFLSAGLVIHIFKLSFDSLFVQASFALGALNMLPILGFDGGRILYAILQKHLPQNISKLIMKSLSFTFIFSLWVFSLYVMIRVGASVGVYIFSASMFTRIFLQERF